MSDERRIEYRQQVLAAYRASGMTQKAFCREHSISLSTLGYWLRRERESENGASGMVQIRAGAETDHGNRGSTLRIRVPQQLELEVDLPVSGEQLAEILQAAASI
jgi:transposase-like protein